MENQKYRIEVDHNKCIGNGVCVATDPANLSLKNGKAVLSGGKFCGQVMILEKEMPAEKAVDIITAGHLCPANAIRIIDLSSNKDLVETRIKEDSAKIINALYDDSKDFVLDPKGYFLIRILQDAKEIEVGFCGAKNKVEVIVRGKKPIDIYHTIAHLNIISRMEHASYLGRELQKAHIALKKGIKYVQDDELEL